MKETEPSVEEIIASFETRILTQIGTLLDTHLEKFTLDLSDKFNSKFLDVSNSFASSLEVPPDKKGISKEVSARQYPEQAP